MEKKISYFETHCGKKTALPLSSHTTNSTDDAGELCVFMNVKEKDLASLKCFFFFSCFVGIRVLR